MRVFQRVHQLSASAVVITLTAPLVGCAQPPAERVVARAATAMAGDARRIEDVKTLRIGMVYPDHEYPVITELRRPDHMRTEGVGNYVLVFDGEHGAFLRRPPAEDGTPRAPGLVDAAYLKDLELDIAFLFPAFLDHPSEYQGRELVDGVETHKIVVTLPLGIQTTYYIDAERYLPLKVVAAVTVDGTAYRPGRVFGDWEDRGGMLYPRTVRYWWVGEDADAETAVVELVEVNPPLGDDRFAIPAEIK